MKPIIYASVIAACFSAAPAFAENVGTVAATVGAEGTVLVIRDGQSVEISMGDPLEMGDRVVVRGDGAATLNAFSCSKTLKAPSMAVLNDTFCDTEVVALNDTVDRIDPVVQAEGVAPAPIQTARAPAAPTGQRGVLGGSLAATAGVASLAAATGSGGGGSSSGTSALALSEGGTANETIVGNVPVEDTLNNTTPLFFNGSGSVGSGLDTGLFGFFEATSS